MVVIAISVLATIGVTMSFTPSAPVQVIEGPKEIVYINNAALAHFNGTDEIRKISSQEELTSIIQTATAVGLQNSLRTDFTSGSQMMTAEFAETSQMFDDNMMFDESVVAKTQSVDGDNDSPNYSTTNIQVKNVDEPDYLKNDSRYVYIVSGNTLSIIDAYPAETAQLVLKIGLDIKPERIENMFLNSDRLVVFYNTQSEDEIIAQYDFVPRRSYGTVTHAVIIDVSEKKTPVIVKDYTIDGNYRDARMIDGYVYFVTNSNLDYQNPRLPGIFEGATRILTSDAYYFDNADQLSNFNTLTAIDIFEDTVHSETYLSGYSGTFYVSENNFYLTYQRNVPFGFYENVAQSRFFDVIVPLLPEEIQNGIKGIRDDSSISQSAQWTEISELMQAAYSKMQDGDRKRLFEEIRAAVDQYDARIQRDVQKTIIHKISIDKDDMDYAAMGSVPGRLLNQFSMDENADRFRVATTTEYYTERHGFVRSNAVYVLDEKLSIVGELDKIALDESIFSARFIADRLYLVTFQQIDPFFVIDLSEDTPKILGELKIPGFSNYLHPYDEEHIIGIGRDTKETGNNRVETLGIKIALFNVSDVSDPKVADEVIIGDRRADSTALYNHKAFFFEKSSGILSIPVTGYQEDLDEIANDDGISSSGYWNGFYVFDLDRADGFSLKGTVPHFDQRGEKYYDYREGGRTFYIEDVLYTASDRYLKMSDLDDLKEINSIKLANTGEFINFVQ